LALVDPFAVLADPSDLLVGLGRSDVDVDARLLGLLGRAEAQLAPTRWVLG
jgi:hypothetical protein